MTTELDQIFGGTKDEPTPQPAPTLAEAEEPTTPEVQTPEAEAVAEAEAPQEEAPEEAAQEPAKEPEAPMVPLAALQEVRQQLKELKALTTPAPQPVKVPDMHEEPEAYTAHVAQQMQQHVIGTKLETSRFLAEREFGAEVVNQAFEYFNENPEGSQALLAHPSPFHAAVEEFNKHKVAQEIGSDPAAYAARIKAEALAEAKAELAAEQVKATAAKPAPTMANVTGTGGGAKPLWNGPTSLDSIL